MYWRQVVSQSPTSADVDQAEIDRYLSVWEPLNQRILTGSSFSGNERNCCFLNTGQRQFADVSGPSALHHIDDGRTLAVTDWDHDGDLDIWMTNRTSPRIRFLRNDTPSNNSFVAFRLEGLPAAKCPRDAYGARVEVAFADAAAGGSKSTRVQTLHGGDSFLSQSSNWLHFGMKPNESISSVAVRWPGSAAPETFSGVQSGRRWLLTQSTGSAQSQTMKPPATRLEPSNLAGVPVKPTGRFKISWPQSVGDLQYHDMNDRLVTRKAASTRPVLYVWWASWCPLCLEELKELSQSDLGGVDVIAVNIEHATSDDPPTNDKLQSILDSVGFRGTSGKATLEMLGTLNQKHLDAIYVRTDLPLPVSFLVDAKGMLRVVYKGRLEVEQVFKDLKQLDAQGRDSMSLAMPFPGRWSEEYLDGNPIAVARSYVQDGAPSDAEAFLKHYLDFTNREETDPPLSAPVRHLRAAAFFELASMAFRSKKTDEGLAYCQSSLKLAPKSVPVMIAIISQYVGRGDYDAALPYCKKVGELAAGHPKVEYQLGMVAMGRREFGKAVEHYQTAIKADPLMFLAANNLAWILATNPDGSIRDGAAAVAAAKLACDATGNGDHRFLSTLAAAHAENRDFKNAVAVTSDAIRIAKSKGDDRAVARFQKRLKLYQSGKPFRE